MTQPMPAAEPAAEPLNATVQSSEIAIVKRLFDDKFEEVADLLAGLPDAALLYQPFAESPWKGPSGSLGLVLAHAISSAVFLLRRAQWVLDRIEWKQVEGDEGREEFGPESRTVAHMQARADRAQMLIHELLDSLTPADLEQSRPHARRPEMIFTVRYEMLHALEHLSQHIGHAQITRQLWALQ